MADSYSGSLDPGPRLDWSSRFTDPLDGQSPAFALSRVIQGTGPREPGILAGVERHEVVPAIVAEQVRVDLHSLQRLGIAEEAVGRPDARQQRRSLTRNSFGFPPMCRRSPRRCSESRSMTYTC